jgi:hypothetical protein
MLKKKIINRYIKIIILIFLFNLNSNSYSEIIIFKKCDNGIDGFKKNKYIVDIKKSLMTREFVYDSKTYKKYKLTDIKTKKENSITRFIYKDGNKILTEKIGYPQFYTQLMFDKNSNNVMIKSVINNEIGITTLSKCKKIEIFQSES